MTKYGQFYNVFTAVAVLGSKGPYWLLFDGRGLLGAIVLKNTARYTVIIIITIIVISC